MRKGFIVILILNLMVLSSWEGLHFFHSLLHKIPNPFHHHSHHASIPVYHHDYLNHKTSHSHSHSHSHQEATEEHGLSDHLNLSSERDDLPYSTSSDNYLLKDFFKLTGKLEKATFEENIFKLPFQKLTILPKNDLPSSTKGRPDVPPPELA